MAFDAGAVVGHLELALSGWKKSVETIKKDQQSLSGFALRHEQQIKSLGKSFTVAGGVMVASLGALIYKTADYGDKINDLSQRTGVATEILSGYKLAADNSGTSIDGVATAFKFLSQRMVDAYNGGKESTAMFKSLGVEVKNADGSLRDSNDVMLDMAEAFASMEDGARKTDLSVAAFGKSGMEMIPFLNLGKQGFKDNYENARRFGTVLSKEAAKAADEFNDSLRNMKSSLAGAGMAIGTALMPTVKDLVEKVTSIVTKFREWSAEHPALTRVVALLAGGVGGLMLVVGPLLLALPSLVKGFQLLKPIIGKMGVPKLSGEITTLSGGLKALPAAGMAAFAGWQVGRLIGELTGLDKVMQGVFDKTFRFVGIIKDSNAEVGTSAGHIAAAARQQEIFARAFEISGQRVERLPAAIAILSEEYKKHGTTGSEALDKIAKGHLDAEAAEVKHKKGIEAIIPPTEAALAAQKRWTDFLAGAGIMTLREKAARLSELSGYLGQAEGLYKTGKITAADYAKAVQAASDEAADMGKAWKTALPHGRDLMAAIRQMPSGVGAAVYAYKSLDDQIKDLSDQFMVSEASILHDIYEIRRAMLALAGITLPALPPLDFGPVEGAAKTATENTKGYFDGLYNDIARGFGDAASGLVGDIVNGLNFADGKFFEHGINVKKYLIDAFDSVKAAFFRNIGEMVSDKVLGLFKSLFDGVGKAGKDALGGISGVAENLGKSAGGIASGLLSSLGSIGSIVSGITGVLELFKGPQKQTDVTYWLKFIKDNSQILVNLFTADYLGIIPAITAMPEKLDWINDGIKEVVNAVKFSGGGGDWLRQIAINTENTWKILDKAKFAQGGYEGLVSGATMFVAGERRPEWVSIRPLPEPRAVSPAAGRTGGGQSISVVNNISVTLDPTSDRDTVRRRFMPELLAAFEANYMKSLFRQQLGA